MYHTYENAAIVIIFNGVLSEDAVVSVPGVYGKVGGVSTLTAIAIIFFCIDLLKITKCCYTSL